MFARMPLILGTLEVFPGADAELRAVFESAASACAPNVTWTVSAYEGTDLGGTRVTLEGPTLAMIWTPWVQDRPGRYSTVVMRDGLRWQGELEAAIRSMISKTE
jgi:hypothetical protein